MQYIQHVYIIQYWWPEFRRHISNTDIDVWNYDKTRSLVQCSIGYGLYGCSHCVAWHGYRETPTDCQDITYWFSWPLHRESITRTRHAAPRTPATCNFISRSISTVFWLSDVHYPHVLVPLAYTSYTKHANPIPGITHIFYTYIYIYIVYLGIYTSCLNVIYIYISV